mgnify:CR=1 FL=1
MSKPYYKNFDNLKEAESYLFKKEYNLNREETKKAGLHVFVYTSKSHRVELREVNGEVKFKRTKLESDVSDK